MLQPGRVGGRCSAWTVTRMIRWPRRPHHHCDRSHDPLGLLEQWASEGMESQQRGEQNHRLMLLLEEELNLHRVEKVQDTELEMQEEM